MMRFGVLVCTLGIIAFAVLLPGCGLPPESQAKIAKCGALYDACFLGAKLAPGDNATKMAAYKLCRAQVDASCLDTPAPADSAPVLPSAGVAPSAAPSTAPSTAPAVPSATAAPCVPDAFHKVCRD